MQTATQGAITLNRAGEPWVGSFPGLGAVTVAHDGEVTVTVTSVDSDDLDTARREAALRHGWGEPLSWSRRGFLMLQGGCATPDPRIGCVLLSGDLHEFGRFLPTLANTGWSFLSDRYTPARWEASDLMAQPVQAPILLAARRAAKSGWDGQPLRDDSDSLAVDVTRMADPLPIRGVVQLQRARPDEPAFEPLSGHQRFEVAASLSWAGVFASDAQDTQQSAAPDIMQRHLQLAALPMARLRSSGEFERIPAEAEQLSSWWLNLGDATS